MWCPAWWQLDNWVCQRVYDIFPDHLMAPPDRKKLEVWIHRSVTGVAFNHTSLSENVQCIFLLGNKLKADWATSMPKKYLSGPRSFIWNWRWRWDFRRKISLKSSPVMTMSSTYTTKYVQRPDEEWRKKTKWSASQRVIPNSIKVELKRPNQARGDCFRP